VSEFTGYGRKNTIDFGDYVQYSNGYSKELHIYKVVGSLQSNSYQDTPDTANSKKMLHSEIVPCLNIIHCGIDETEVIRVKENDCIKMNSHDALTVRVKELEEALRSTLKRCKMIELPQNYEILHGKADSLLQK